MYFIKDFVQKYIADLTLDQVKSEIIELLEVKTLDNFLEESNDICFVFQSWLHLKTQVNWPMIWHKRSVAKMQDRLVWWEKHFQKLNLDFHPKYWKNGSNYNKPEKVDKAIGLAIREILNKQSSKKN